MYSSTTKHLRKNAPPSNIRIHLPKASSERPEISMSKASALYNTRKDTFGKDVVRGDVLATLREVADEKVRKRMNWDEFRSKFQCPADEPGLHSSESGVLSMLKMVPPTKDTVLLMCMFVETRCNWTECSSQVSSFRQGHYSSAVKTHEGNFNLLRIKNNELFVDWPWSRRRSAQFRHAKKDGSTMLRVNSSIDALMQAGNSVPDYQTALISMVLSLLNVDDSVFMMGTGEEHLVVPWNFPFPFFANSPRIGEAAMPWPWQEGFSSELRLLQAANPKAGFSDKEFDRLTSTIPWQERIPKASFCGAYHELRHMVFDQAALRPDLIDVDISKSTGLMKPWHPMSTETPLDLGAQPSATAPTNGIPPSRDKPGFVTFLRNLTLKTSASVSATYHPERYKYVVVVGSERVAASRLPSLLAHSGAVILMAKSESLYHFSSRLIPWTHYVPLAYSSADLIDKIEWLRKNDDLAQQIASNGRNFGKSHLRLEDYLCYAGAALRAVADVERNTTATAMFTSPTDSHPQYPSSPSFIDALLSSALVYLPAFLMLYYFAMKYMVIARHYTRGHT